MTSGYRGAHGALIDRSAALHFRFDGTTYGGFAGDTLASALLANGVRLVGRSFKYHRPRGIFSAGPEEPNALVELGAGARREPNSRATTVELFDGLEARSQNRFPTLSLDLMSVASIFAPFFPAGFYYKTFMWPASFWETVYEPLIRRAAGLGRASGLPDPDSYETSHSFCDVLVVGSGPAGLTAALAAARAGARVTLCEQDFVLGGRLSGERLEIAGRPAIQWVREVETELRSRANVTLLLRAGVFGAYDGNTYAVIERVVDPYHRPGSKPRHRVWKIVARRAVIATGAIERPIAFGGNDRPGVMLASAVRTYVNRFGVVPGQRVCVFTTTDDGWKTAADLAAAGAEVAAVVDARQQVAEDVSNSVRRAGTRIELGANVTATRGSRCVRAVCIDSSRGSLDIEADTLAVSGGWNPALGLTSHLGSRPSWSEQTAAFVPGPLPPGMDAAGAVTGTFALSACLEHGALAGSAAAQAAGFPSLRLAIPSSSPEHIGVEPTWRSRTTRGKVFVDFQNDVTDADVALAHREGLVHLEHMKRYTTHGMATDQGKTSGIIGQALFAVACGQALESMGVPIARPPEIPVAIAALAGRHRGHQFRPTRRTASHRWAQGRGAVFTETGDWLRAQWFPTKSDGGDGLASVSREAAAVRSAAGVCDVSTLGKIDVQGPDSGTFLDRVYVNSFSTLPVGKARYGVMLREDGFVLDDGTTSRLAAHHYFMTTTTANAAKVMQHLQFCLQVLWPQLDVQLVSVTEQWTQYAIAGPNARSVLARVVDAPFDIANQAFPFLSAASLFVCGRCPARLFRISFSGELAYELAVPARHAESTLRSIVSAGEEFGLVPYGTEALSVLRIEKGHVAGNEINGHTTAADLGLGRMLSRTKDFIGRVLAGRPGLVDPERPTLVGLAAAHGHDGLRAGAHLFRVGAALSPENDAGYVTSVAFSPALGTWIGLGLLKGGPRRIGERIRCWDPVRSGDVEVEVRHPIFIDPEGKRLRG